jgi:DNA-binding SARP family transcriptional activator
MREPTSFAGAMTTRAGAVSPPRRLTPRPPTLRLNLLSGFDLQSDERAVQLPLSAQRVVAFLALHDRPLHRVFVAGNLWIDASEERASASLRTALWRLCERARALVVATSTQLSLSPAVGIDVRDHSDRARDVLNRRRELEGDELEAFCGAGELLPDWYDDWVLLERERFRQLHLYALETLCALFTEAGRFSHATQAGLAAVSCEPLRESAHRALMRAYIADGNSAEALRQYRLYRGLMRAELGLEPSEQMEELVGLLPRGDGSVTGVA